MVTAPFRRSAAPPTSSRCPPPRHACVPPHRQGCSGSKIGRFTTVPVCWVSHLDNSLMLDVPRTRGRETPEAGVRAACLCLKRVWSGESSSERSEGAAVQNRQTTKEVVCVCEFKAWLRMHSTGDGRRGRQQIE
jgi:hypothetical protein